MESKKEIKKIVVIGPESTGKSTLCKQLSAHYNTDWVKEYAREYLEKNGTDYRFEDLYEIAKGQVAGEERQTTDNRRQMTDESRKYDQRPTTNNHLLFIDTDLYVIKIWSEFVFNKCDNRILKEISKRKYDLYLLCNIDLPWVKDNLREYPDLQVRKKLFQYYKEDMCEQKTPWAIISGGYEERLKMSLRAVDEVLSK